MRKSKYSFLYLRKRKKEESLCKVVGKGLFMDF